MYFAPELNDLCMNRGDSYSLPITINQGDAIDFSLYRLKEDDVIYVGITEPGQSFEDAIIRKVITYDDTDNGIGVLNLNPGDTEYVMTGKYYIEMKLKQMNKITTILTPKQFWITGTNPPKSNMVINELTFVEEEEVIWDGGEL
jgi:hypothetical protein